MTKDLKISLAMSGGGFRATLFHLGVVKRLFELGLFKNIKTISSVSGGTILNGLLGINYDALESAEDFEALIQRPIIRFSQLNFRGKNIFHSLKRLFSPAKSSSEEFARLLDKHLYHNKTLGSLSQNVRTVINATNLNSSSRWSFERERFGDYETGYCESADSFPLSRAVAAGTEFPGLFSALKIKAHKYRFYFRDEKRKDKGENMNTAPLIYLTDGAIYDSSGYYALLHELESESGRFIIISDASGSFHESGKRYGYLSQLTRTMGVALERLNSLMQEKLFAKLDSDEFRGLYLSLKESCRQKGADSVGCKDGEIELLNKLRTDLEHFNDIEVDYLIYHGASLVDTTLRKWHSDIYSSCESVSLPKPDYPADRVEQVLTTSNRQIRVW